MATMKATEEQMRFLRELVGIWDAKVPASDDATALLLVLIEVRQQLDAIWRTLDVLKEEQA